MTQEISSTYWEKPTWMKRYDHNHLMKAFHLTNILAQRSSTASRSMFSKWLRSAPSFCCCGDGWKFCWSLRIHHEYAIHNLGVESHRIHLCVHLVSRKRKAGVWTSAASLQGVVSRRTVLVEHVRTRWIEGMRITGRSSSGRLGIA